MMHNYTYGYNSQYSKGSINNDIVNFETLNYIAKQHCIQTLLNCFYRETCSSKKYIRIINRKQLKQIHAHLPQPLFNHFGLFMVINLPSMKTDITIAIKNDSKIGFCQYQSIPYVQLTNASWKSLLWNELAELLLKELSHFHGESFNHELYEQIKNSVRVMSRAIEFHKNKKSHGQISFIESEQSLIFGHAFHPSPKNREGLKIKEIQEYSPELKAKFALHYFLVREDFIIQNSLLEKSAIDLVAENSPDSLQKKDNYALICTHPWQAHYLKKLPLVKKALQEGHLHDLGQHGEHYYPTSSVRTVYHPNNPFFYKLSLNIRITNCVRKNAIYELKSAVCLTKIIQTKMDDVKNIFPDFHIMLEPAYISVDLPEGTAEERKEVMEGFGMIFRQNFSQEQLDAATPTLAGSLFGKSLTGSSHIHENMTELATKLHVSYESAALTWLNQYLEKCLHPLLYFHFNLGITFEPHLQNVLIGIKDHMPECIFIRDLEGTKLDKEKWPEDQLIGLEVNAKQSVYYAEQLAWNRMAYCLLVNNIGEAVFHLANGCAQLESRLWKCVRESLLSFQEKYGNDHSKQRIHGLLSHDPLPIKCNLTTRFLKRADKGAVYEYLTDHPLKEKLD